MAVNTSGLSGYALQVANGINSGQSISQATAAANQTAYGNSAGPTAGAQTAQALSGTGFVPSAPTNTPSLIPNSTLAKTGTLLNTLGATYDAASGGVNMNGKIYTPAQLSDMGVMLSGDNHYVVVNPEKFNGGYSSTPVTPEDNSLVPPALPKLEVPTLPQYQIQPFQAETPNYSITSDPSKTSFIPTASAKNRWLEQEQLNADNAYKTYTSQANAYNQNYQEQQDAIANEQKTVAAQSAAAIAAANAKVDAGNAAWAQDPSNPDNILKQAQANYYNDRPTSSGSGGLTPYEQYEIQQGTNKSEADSQAAMDKWVTAQVAADPRYGQGAHPELYAALYDAWKTMYVKDNYGGSSNP